MRWNYDTLLEMDGWCFMLERDGIPGGYGDYIFIAHTTCLLGVDLEGIGRGGADKPPSVMHYMDHTCQRCKKSPPDGLFAAYRLYEWGTGAHV